MLAGGLALLGIQLTQAVRRRSALTLIPLLFAGLVIAMGLLLAGVLSAPIEPVPSHLNASLRLVVNRRSRLLDYLFHGVLVEQRSNRAGWEDDEPRDGAKARFAFIGDSFLEVRSTRNLARRVEDLLNSRGADVEVLNLSVSDTGPEEYRHRFYEVALPQRPAHILVFIYALNDLSLDFHYEPYRHPTFWVTRQSEEAVRDFSPELADQLRKLEQGGTDFDSRQDFLSRLHASSESAQLAYLATLAYSQPPGGRRSLLERTEGFLRQVASAVARLRPEPESGRTEQHGTKCAETPWTETWQDYKELFELPRPERLDAIGAFIARRYCRSGQPEPFQRVLEAQSEEFREFVASGPDMPYFLFPAVAEAVDQSLESAKRGKRHNRGRVSSVSPPVARQLVDPQAVLAAAGQYEQLLVELRRAAEAHSARFTVVLIPEASMVDASFRRFWAGLPGLDRFARRQALYRSLALRLRDVVDTIDLATPDGLLDGGYWWLDGHLNEAGNHRVAELLSERLRTEALKSSRSALPTHPAGQSSGRR